MSAIPMSLVSPNRPAIDFVVARLVQEAKSLCHGDLTGKEQSDYLEFLVNRYIVTERTDWDPRCDLSDAVRIVEEIQSLVDRLPTQSRRDEESEKYQQFSTPPHYAFVAAWAANLSPKDTLLEPSAGIGGLASWAFNRVENVWLNELSVRRTALLKRLIRDCGLEYEVFSENAEQLENVLPDYVKPSVILQNPPFSATAGRLQGKATETGAMHVEQALMRLQDGGRLVAILGRGMAPDKPTFAPWWSKISKQYTVRCNIGVDGSVYAKYGTRFSSRIIVVDKCGPTVTPPIVFDVANLSQALGLLSVVRTMRGSVPAKQESLFGKGPSDETPIRIGEGQKSDEVELSRNANGPIPRKQQRRVRGVRNDHNDSPTQVRSLSQSVPVSPIEIEVIEPSSSSNTEMTDAIFEAYRPQRMRVPGAKPHPTPLVQSAAMASVLPPVPTYRPKLPDDVVMSGALSEEQIECVAYAGQAFSQWLEPVDGVRHRRGFLIGDGTGAGKGRQGAAIILDSFMHGQTRAVWMTASKKLIRDAKRDWSDLGQNPADFIDIGSFKATDALPNRNGILFVTYATLRAGSVIDAPVKFPKLKPEEIPDFEDISRWEQRDFLSLVNKPSESNWRRGRNIWIPRKSACLAKLIGDEFHEYDIQVPEKRMVWEVLDLPIPKPKDKKGNGRSRLEQVLEWLGPDFEGVIWADESHRCANALDMDSRD